MASSFESANGSGVANNETTIDTGSVQLGGNIEIKAAANDNNSATEQAEPMAKVLEFKPKSEGSGSEVKGVPNFEAIVRSTDSVFDKALDKVGELGGKMKAGMGRLMDRVRGFGKSTAEVVGGAVLGAKESLASGYSKVMESMNQKAETIKARAEKARDKMSNGMDKALDGVLDKIIRLRERNAESSLDSSKERRSEAELRSEILKKAEDLLVKRLEEIKQRDEKLRARQEALIKKLEQQSAEANPEIEAEDLKAIVLAIMGANRKISAERRSLAEQKKVLFMKGAEIYAQRDTLRKMNAEVDAQINQLATKLEKLKQMRAELKGDKSEVSAETTPTETAPATTTNPEVVAVNDNAPVVEATPDSVSTEVEQSGVVESKKAA